MRRHSHSYVLSLVAVFAICGELRAESVPNPREAPSDCSRREIEYALSGRVRLTDTPFGAGNGVYDVGPGRLVLRVVAVPDTPSSFNVELIDYRMQSRFTVRSKVLFWSAKVLTQSQSRVASGTAGRGTLSGTKLTWTTPIQGYRVDGTIICDGSGCGMSGVPPDGESSLRIGPEPVRFAPFVFGDRDLETFKMSFAKLTHTEQPRQTSHLAIAGRKMKERCVGP